MEHLFLYLALALPCLLITCKLWSQTRGKNSKNLPPSPPALPIIGWSSYHHRPPWKSASPKMTSSYGDLWRNLRRISAFDVFSSNRLNSFASMRRDEIRILLNKLYRASGDDFAKVELRPMFMELTFNIIMRMVAGKSYYSEDVTDKDKADAKQFRQLIREILKHVGASYLGDFLPVLQWIDYQGFLKKVTRLGKRTDMLLQGLIDEHRHPDKGSFESRNTMISHLLSLQESQPEDYSDRMIKALILECSVGEYRIEPNTMLLANAWDIHRQPELWDDVEKFKPERFQAGTNDQVYKLIPFGLGRRSCPGIGLANRVLGFTLGSLIQCVEWKRIGDKEIDMSEGVGLSMPKAEPLHAMCKARDVMKKAYP